MNLISNIFQKILKFLKIIFSEFYSLIYLFIIYDRKKILRLEKSNFDYFKFNVDDSILKLNAILNKKYSRNFNRDLDSIHWLIFSALSKRNSIKNILEIGTYDGEFTYILSQLFPKSKITTIDLPEDDPLMASFYGRADSTALSNYMKKQYKNINQKNIRAVKSNTFFLLDVINEKEKFDLIWVDGGHLYPDVAWDICNAFFLLKKGGFLLCDDVIRSKNFYRSNYVSTESWEVLKYIAERTNYRITYFLKRMDKKLYSSPHSRKYVAVLEKK